MESEVQPFELKDALAVPKNPSIRGLFEMEKRLTRSTIMNAVEKLSLKAS